MSVTTVESLPFPLPSLSVDSISSPLPLPAPLPTPDISPTTPQIIVTPSPIPLPTPTAPPTTSIISTSSLEDSTLPTPLPTSTTASSLPTPPSSIPHWSWKHVNPTTGKLKYLQSNIWDKKIDQPTRETCRRYSPVGVEVRDLPPGHFLAGEQGLFATKNFLKYDILGEYTGRIVPSSVGGHYVALLEDKEYNDSMGVDAQDCGNEMRFINSYINIATRPNVKMRTAYIGTYPHIVVLCIEDIEIGEEILLDYGEEYTNMYLKPPTIRDGGEISWKKLPFLNNSDDEDESSEEEEKEAGRSQEIKEERFDEERKEQIEE